MRDIAEDEAVGVVISGEPAVCYGPGTHDVTPTLSGGEEYPGDDWRTVTFPNGTTTFSWAHVGGPTRTDVEVGVEVLDPHRVWNTTQNADVPVRNVLMQVLKQVTGDRTPLAQLTARNINRQMNYAGGIEFISIDVEIRTLSVHEIEIGGDGSEPVFVLERGHEPRTESEDDSLIDSIQTALEAEQLASNSLGATTLNARLDTEGLDVIQVGDRTTVQLNTSEATRVDVEAAVELVDVETLWQHVDDPARPLEAILEAIITDVLESDTELDELTVEDLPADTTTECGVDVRSITAREWIQQQYDLETIDGEYVRLHVQSRAEASDSANSGERSEQLRQLVGSVTTGDETLTDLDARTINARSETTDGIHVDAVEEIDRAEFESDERAQ
jgi:hypothetical protein